jgi:hypothetical protein
MQFEVTIDQQGFKGKATIDFLTRAEKMSLVQELKKLGYGAKEDDEEAVTDSKIALGSKMGEVVDQRLVSLDVTHTESGTQITDKAMLDIYSEGQALVGVIGHFLLGGVTLGKPKS